MTQQEWPNEAPGRQPGPDESIDFELLVHAAWRRRHLVLAMTVVGALAGLGASVASTRYVSRGLLLTPEVSVGDYKRYEAAMSNEPRLERFLAASGKADAPVAEQMRFLVHEPGMLADAVKPMFSFTDRDAKQFGVKVEEGGELVGVELTLKDRERPTESPVLLLAEYVRDTAISVDLESAFLRSCLQNDGRERELRNEQLESEFQVTQLEARASSLREIIERLPDSSGLDVRQVVSVENGGERFLPPATHLAAVEIAIGEHRTAEARRARDRIAAAITKKYYCETRKLIESGVSGRDLLQSLEGLQTQALAGQDPAASVVEATANSLALEGQRWVNRYLAQMRFVASPQGAQTRERKPGRVTGLVLGTALGGLFGLLLAISMGWWRVHRDEILADDR